MSINGVNSYEDANVALKSSPKFNSPSVQQVTPPIDHGEGPIWDGRKNILYYVDSYAGVLLSYHYNTKKVNSIKFNGIVTAIIPSKKNENLLVVGVDRTLVAIEWDGENKVKRSKNLTTVSDQFPKSRFNDGKADSRGRIWIGTIGFENHETGTVDLNQGILYKISRKSIGHPQVEVAPVNISNGLCWNKENDKMYYIDTPTRKVIEYTYNNIKGEISNPRVAVDISFFTEITGNPDGMTIDTDGNLWIALIFGGCVIQANPKTGQLLQVIPIPARDVTSVMWGGPNLDILFVTTSRFKINETERKVYPAAGSVFAVSNLKQRGFHPYFTNLISNIA